MPPRPSSRKRAREHRADPAASESKSALGAPPPSPSADSSQADRALLEAGVASLVAPPERKKAVDQLMRFFSLLRQGNRRSNLVSRGDEARLIERHALDSFLPVPILDELGPGSLLDLGSGGGLPGIPIKILRPSLQVTLLDSRRMKTLFLFRTVLELGLTGIRVWRGRVEDLAALPSRESESGPAGGVPTMGDLEGPASRPRFDAVVARAVSALPSLARWSAPLVGEGGYLLALKGSRLDEEVGDWERAPGPWRLLGIRRDLRPQTHMVILRRHETGDSDTQA